MTALVTDSIAQLPPLLRDRFDVGVVPIIVTLDGAPFREGVDITVADFYERLADGAAVTTAAPAPGEVLELYEQARAGGAAEILSVHTGADYSATINAVNVAAGMSPVPVRVVDSGQVSFPTAACVWAAGDALAAGQSLDAAAQVAARTGREVGNVFVIGALELARSGGRLAVGTDVEAQATVVALEPSGLQTVAQVGDIDAAIDAMATYVAEAAHGRGIRVGVGDAVAPDLGAALADRIGVLPVTADLVRYEIGPSVGAHTGAGTVGAVFFPVS